MTKAKLINDNNGQTVLLPREFHFDCSEVYVRRDPLTGDVVLSRKPDSWESFFDSALKTDVPADFMDDRGQAAETRDPFDGWKEAGTSNEKDGANYARSVRIEAFRVADAIMALEGFTPSADFEGIRQSVIDGHLTFDEAVHQIIQLISSRVADKRKS